MGTGRPAGDRFERVDRAHEIRLERGGGIAPALADRREPSEVDHRAGCRRLDRALDRARIEQVEVEVAVAAASGADCLDPLGLRCRDEMAGGETAGSEDEQRPV